MGGGVWVQLLEGQGGRGRAILVLRECIWNVPAVFDADSLGYPSGWVVYPRGFHSG